MFKGKIDIKVIFIIILAVALILSFIFRPSKNIDNHEDEIELLNKENERLFSVNDSLQLENLKLNKKREQLIVSIDSTKVLLDENKDKSKDLENGKSKVSTYVDRLNVDGVTSSLSEYLNRRK